MGRPEVPVCNPAVSALDSHQPDDCACHDGPNVTSPVLDMRATWPIVETIDTEEPASAMRCRKGKRYPGAGKPSGNSLPLIAEGVAKPSIKEVPISTGVTAPSMQAASQRVAQSAAGIPRRASHSAAQPASSANPQPRPAPRAALVMRLRISENANVTIAVMRLPRRGRACPETG